MYRLRDKLLSLLLALAMGLAPIAVALADVHTGAPAGSDQDAGHMTSHQPMTAMAGTADHPCDRCEAGQPCGKLDCSAHGCGVIVLSLTSYQVQLVATYLPDQLRSEAEQNPLSQPPPAHFRPPIA